MLHRRVLKGSMHVKGCIVLCFANVACFWLKRCVDCCLVVIHTVGLNTAMYETRILGALRTFFLVMVFSTILCVEALTLEKT